MTETRGATAAPERDRHDKRGRRPGPAKRLVAWFQGLSLFYRQVVAELRKVVWPTRKELITYTWVVIVFVLAVIAFVSVLDLGFSHLTLWVFG